MAKPTATEVKAIIDTSLTDSDVDSYVDDANSVVKDALGSEDKMLTKWLAAHLMAATRERQVRTEEALDASVGYVGSTGMGLDATLYGQQVKAMDTSGKLAKNLAGLRKARIKAVKAVDWQ